jgi:simple sugar transport system permease protein
MEMLFSYETLISGITLTVPILLAALGGMFSDQANLFNIALESFMLFGAFFSVVGSFLFASPWMGFLIAGIAGILVALIFGVLVIDYKADTVVVGIALNMSAWGVTSLLLELIFGVRGFLMDPRVISFPNVELPIIKAISLLGKILSGHNLFVYITVIITLFVYILTYKSKLGLRIRALGQNPDSLETAGLSTRSYRYIAVIINGFLCGIAGASLTLSGLSMFSENMSAGKGFIALAAVLLAQGKPKFIILASIIFGYAEAIGVKMQGFGIPHQLVLMTPYIITMIFLFVGTRKKPRRLGG